MISISCLAGCNSNEQSEVVKVESVSLNETSYTLEVGDSFTLVTSVLPSNASNKAITWLSSNESVATVQNGVVTALAKGNTTITANTVDQSKTASCNLVVTNHITKILMIGNSFGEDTSRFAPVVAESLGFDVLLGHMFIGGCNTTLHRMNADNDAHSYRYYKSYKQGWLEKNNVSIQEGVMDEKWDYILINGLTSEYDYNSDLDPLLKYIGIRATNPNVKLGFNMTQSYNSMHSMYKSPIPPEDSGLAFFYNNFKTFDFNSSNMYNAFAESAQTWLKNTLYGQFILPMGTAIENAKLVFDENDIHRDGFHLSHFLGRYIAALTYMFYFSGAKDCSYVPTFITQQEAALAVKCALAAIEHPFQITDVREE